MSSIYRKLVVYFLLLNLFAIGSVGVYSYYKEKEALLSRTFDQLISVRMEKKTRIIGFFRQRISDMENISRLPQVRKIMSEVATSGKGFLSRKNKSPLDQYHKYLFDYLKDAGCYTRLLLLDDATRAYSLDLRSPFEKYQILQPAEIKALQNFRLAHENKKKAFVKEVVFNPERDHPVLLIGKNIFDKSGHFLEMLALEIRPAAINAIMFENNPDNPLSNTVEVYLVGNDDLMRSNSRFLKNSVFKTKVKTPGVFRALKGITGQAQFKDYRNIPVLSAYSPLNFSGIHWAILAEIDAKEAMIPIYSIRDNIIYLSLLIALISAAVITFLSRKFSDPIKKLKAETTKIAAGEYGNTLEVETKDEIGELTRSFNEMSVRLKVQADKLESEKKLRLRSVIDAQEEERQRLSRELHDGLGPLLLTGKMKLESALNTKKEAMKATMGEVMKLFSDTVQEIRNISNNMMPSGLKEFGLSIALQNLCKEVMDNHPIKIHLVLDLKQNHYAKTTEIYLFRIVQEAINNTLKHAGARHIQLSLEEIESHLFFTLRDDGRGFDADSPPPHKGNGLINMKERVNLLNGYFELTTSPGKGTKIDIEIPI
ncbi:MAG TPA: HAMP domain-containing protein [Bacteroidetes bacterium]|nr:HAMP domain-containing protein [Bacteroidota bacterium]